MTSGSRIIVVNDSSTARGGATGLALLAARLLVERGREVVLLCGDSGSDTVPAELGVEVVPFGGQRLLNAGRSQAMVEGLWNRRAGDFLSRWIADHGRPDDVWHVHSWTQIWSPSVFKALQPVRNRLVVHAHDYFVACPNGTFWNYPAESHCRLTPMSRQCVTSKCDKRGRLEKSWRLARQRLVGEFFRGPDMPLVLLIHPGMASALERSGLNPARLRTLRNPAEPFLPMPVTPADNTELVYVGRLAADKGVLELARAAEQVGVALTFVGEGPMADDLREVSPRATFAGWQDGAGIARYAQTARALVMPTVYAEPFGLVAVEALGSGIPVAVSSSALLAPEIVEAGAGWALDPTDAQDFANTLKLISELPGRELNEFGRRAVAASTLLGTTPATWCDGLEEAYDALARGAS